MSEMSLPALCRFKTQDRTVCEGQVKSRLRNRHAVEDGWSGQQHLGQKLPIFDRVGQQLRIAILQARLLRQGRDVLTRLRFDG